jgi:hypothetical protein
VATSQETPRADVGDEVSVKHKRSRAQLVLERRDEELRAVLSQPVGRAVLWAVLEQCGIYRSSFSPEALNMAFQEGGRNVGLELITRIQSVDPNAYTLMTREAVAQEDNNG